MRVQTSNTTLKRLRAQLEGSKLKNSLGDHFVSQNDDFARGWTSDITHRGMLRE